MVATFSGKTMKATKLKKAAQTTAARGDSTLVETTVATELAASCRPFRKSKVSARRMSSQMAADIWNQATSPKFRFWKKCMLRSL